MTHGCEPLADPTEDDPREWICPTCKRAWKRREGFSVIDAEEFFDFWYQPADS
ncbi:hypothetical protein GCM10010156_73470 [Planobispora rosea]|uniref:Uncharacterized protein n=1 Tax=Planobispora rosea TaxID=35762 RepID=A0A8J3SBS5_PLARO|nr:hypothetical protein [Planobispora rosea]GGT05056.1 hypothetical protein GCM10010156_73470 [Planobispora rosea]GIH88854.1 hypothetical protein Pro02_72620 [Planobispora rosea]